MAVDLLEKAFEMEDYNVRYNYNFFFFCFVCLFVCFIFFK